MSLSNEENQSIDTTLLIQNQLGLHARAAAKFVSTTSKFTSEIEVVKDEQHVNGKSIMGIMTLAAVKGTQLQIHAKGNDAKELIDALEDLVKDNFGEAD